MNSNEIWNDIELPEQIWDLSHFSRKLYMSHQFRCHGILKPITDLSNNSNSRELNYEPITSDGEGIAQHTVITKLINFETLDIYRHCVYQYSKNIW